MVTSWIPAHGKRLPAPANLRLSAGSPPPVGVSSLCGGYPTGRTTRPDGTPRTTASFRFLKDYLEISDSDLSKHMSALEAAGYVSSSKAGRGRGATTTYMMTRLGQKAYAAHRDALRALLDGPVAGPIQKG